MPMGRPVATSIRDREVSEIEERTLACWIMANARAASAARSRALTRIRTISEVVVPLFSAEDKASTRAIASQYTLAL